jgi:hypothetical protein
MVNDELWLSGYDFDVLSEFRIDLWTVTRRKAITF